MVPAAAMADMGVELKLFATRSVEDLLGDASGKESGGTGRAARLEESIKSLEEEKRKIEAFKRELPLCVHLLSDVIEELHREIERCRFERSSRGFKEFIPIKSCEVAEDTVGEAGTDCKEKMNWMSSALLWSDNYGANNDRVKKHNESNAEENFEVDHGKANLLRECEGRNGRGALVPFKDLSTFAASCKEEEKPDLSLQSPAINNTLGLFSSGCGSKAATKIPDLSPANSAAHLSLNQSSRKARRCWSQELHRRFVLAIQQLGGAQVATPKQIREHMKVDGLTNDEVKSHLQKYRMHSLRVSNTSARQSRSVGVLGGLWVPQEQYTTSSSQQSVSQSASPQSPFQLASSTCALSVTAGDVSEEEGKSESFSWNRRKVVALR